METQSTVISVKVPIEWQAMTEDQRTRLSRITSRDTRVVRAFLGVIALHENDLIVGKTKKRIDGTKLEKLTLTAERYTDPAKLRLTVPHDMKKRFRNISFNELQECRQVATAMWNSYLALEGKKPLSARYYRERKIPRYVFSRRFKIVYSPEKEIHHWLEVVDSLDSWRKDGPFHDRLAVHLSPSSYHLNRLREGEVTSFRFLKDSKHKWWAIFSVRTDTPVVDTKGKPPAVMGIDLGINRAVCSVVLTQGKVRHVRYFTNPEKSRRISRYDEMLDALQRERNTRLNDGVPADGVTRRLCDLSERRKHISVDYDRVMVKQLAVHIIELSQRYNLYVAIGDLRYIRDSAGRSSGRGKSFRTKVGRWSFARVTGLLRHALAQSGWPVEGRDNRLVMVREQWTSKTCHRCGNIGIRPKQSLFVCPTCGYRSNADMNGAVNIARRLIRLIPSLRDEKNGLGRWLLPRERAGLSPKAWRSRRSKGRSGRPLRTSDSRGSNVVECDDQMTLESFASTADPTMVRTAETPPAATAARKASDGRGTTAQRTEAQSGPLGPDKARDERAGVYPVLGGDTNHEKGETRELKASRGVHSPLSNCPDRSVHAAEHNGGNSMSDI